MILVKSPKPWFNNECRRLRIQYRRAKNHKRRVNNVENFQFLHNASKDYKKCLNKHLNEYKKDFIKKLRSLKSSYPKAYLNILNKSSGCSSNIAQKVSLDTFAEHFRKLNTISTENSDMIPEVDPAKVSEYNLELNAEITEQEVLMSLNKLKLNKACASDLILNEFLKFSKTKMLLAFTKIFNLVFASGIIPDGWSQGTFHLIYKNKGDKTSPDNYRGITILSCFGKLFTSILNDRLNKYLENMNVVNEEQAGFRKKALDSVNRSYLWQKLLSNNIDGKMFKIIHNMYANAKSYVRLGHLKSSKLSSNVGVRQGENLSPVLFSLFLNDLTEFISHAYDGLTNVSDMANRLLSDDDIEVYFKLYILLYADDTVIFAESNTELQAALNAMY